MHITSTAFFALLAFAAAYDTDVWHKDVKYRIAGLPEEGVQCSRASKRFDKDELARVIGEVGGEKKGAKGKYPEKLGSRNQASLPPLQNGCSFEGGTTLWSVPFALDGEEVVSWLDSRANKRTPFRMVYRIDENNVYTYCAAAEHPEGNASDYQGCPS